MTKADIATIMPFEEALFGSESWTSDAYAAELADRKYRHYVVSTDDTGLLTGWAGLLVIADTAQILTIGVVPAMQRRGVGQFLLDTLLEEARARGAIEALLEVRVDNHSARRLYERNRFYPLRTRRGYYDLGRVDALEMKRDL